MNQSLNCSSGFFPFNQSIKHLIGHFRCIPNAKLQFHPVSRIFRNFLTEIFSKIHLCVLSDTLLWLKHQVWWLVRLWAAGTPTSVLVLVSQFCRKKTTVLFLFNIHVKIRRGGGGGKLKRPRKAILTRSDVGNRGLLLTAISQVDPPAALHRHSIVPARSQLVFHTTLCREELLFLFFLVSSSHSRDLLMCQWRFARSGEFYLTKKKVILILSCPPCSHIASFLTWFVFVPLPFLNNIPPIYRSPKKGEPVIWLQKYFHIKITSFPAPSTMNLWLFQVQVAVSCLSRVKVSSNLPTLRTFLRVTVIRCARCDNFFRSAELVWIKRWTKFRHMRWCVFCLSFFRFNFYSSLLLLSARLSLWLGIINFLHHFSSKILTGLEDFLSDVGSAEIPRRGCLCRVLCRRVPPLLRAGGRFTGGIRRKSRCGLVSRRNGQFFLEITAGPTVCRRGWRRKRRRWSGQEGCLYLRMWHWLWVSGFSLFSLIILFTLFYLKFFLKKIFSINQ